MKHLLICPEYPPSHGGGIGTYAQHIAGLLAQSGETVHVIGQLWAGAESTPEVTQEGRLTVHRIPYLDWRARRPRQPHPRLDPEAERLFRSEFHPQAFSWQAALLAESLIDREGIDVIEAQEYEAPLYYLQLRRALGLSSSATPPIIVHLHSPTEMILRHNDYPVGHPGLVAARFEDYSIRAADALLSPSHYLAGQVAERFGLQLDSIEVIDYPIGEVSPVARDLDTWGAGRVCYVGRLEGRKGILEWIDAAVAVARRNPTCSFDFVGENVLGDGSLPGKSIVERRIPEDLVDRFRFHGSRPREEVASFLELASFSAVPSRWDNFPNTCIEAMSSGLPVLATREGGMVELVEDGRSGWLAERPDAAALAQTLSRALETPAERLAEMGREAAARIQLRCDNADVVQRQLDFRQHLSQRGAGASLRIPMGRRRTSAPGAKAAANIGASSAKRIAVVVSESLGDLSADTATTCLESLRQQTSPPTAVVLVGDTWGPGAAEGWSSRTRVLLVAGGGDAASRNNRGVVAVNAAEVQPAGFTFVDAADRLEPDFLARCEAVLARCPEVGVVSSWSRQTAAREEYRTRPCPDLPYQWLTNDASPVSVIRTTALAAAGPFRTALQGSFAHWDLINAILVDGWAGVTLPELLAAHACVEETEPSYPSSMRMRALLMERFADEVGREATVLLQLTTLDPRLRLRSGEMSQRERFDLLTMLLRRSGSLIRWFRRVVIERISS